jgi:hypothetical protein
MTCEGHPAFYWSHSAQLLVDTLKREAYRKGLNGSTRNASCKLQAASCKLQAASCKPVSKFLDLRRQTVFEL